MADKVRKVSYYYTMVPNRPGRGAKILDALAKAKVNLLVFSGFPGPRGRAQLDFVPEDGAAFQRAMRGLGATVSPRKTGFVIEGRTLTLADITCPVLAFVGETDDIARPPGVRAILATVSLGSSRESMLMASTLARRGRGPCRRRRGSRARWRTVPALRAGRRRGPCR